MTQTKPDNFEISWLKEHQHKEYLPKITELVKKCQQAGMPGSDAHPARATELLKAITSKENEVRLLLDQGRLVGFTLYRRYGDDKAIQVLKTVIDPDILQEHPITPRLMVYDMGKRLREDCAHSLHYVVHVDDFPLQKALKEEGYMPPGTPGEAIIRNYNDKGDSAVRLQRYLVREGQTQLALYQPREYEEPKNRKELLSRMLVRLEELTKVQWEAAEGEDPSHLKGSEVTFMNADRPTLYLRTKEPVADAVVKQQGLSQFFARSSKPGVRTSTDNTPKQLIIPASWVRNIHMRKAMEATELPGFNGEQPAVASIGG